MRKTALFDLDGTLVDSVPDLAAALNRLAAARDLAPFARQEIIPMIGDGARALVDRAFAARGRTARDADLDAFVADYTAHAAEATIPFDGVPETLASLAGSGWTLAVCTNKPEHAARALLDALDLARLFASVGGGDTFPTRKPDPGHLLGTLRAAGGDAAAAVMIGDHANDVRAARAAHLPGVFARWGYGTEAMAEGASATADRATDLPGLLAGLLA